MAKVKTALVYHCFGIGDICMASSAVNALQSNNYDVTIVCEEYGSDLYRFKRSIVLTYKRNKYFHPEYSSDIENLANSKFDLGVLTVPSWNNEGRKLLEPICGKILAFDPLDEAALRLDTHTVTLNNRLVSDVVWEMRYQPNIGRSLAPGKRYTNLVTLHTGAQSSEWRHKSFPIELWSQVCREILACGYIPAIIGDEKQSCYAAALMEISGVQDYTGQPLRSTCKMLENDVALALGNDCGPQHLAAAIGVPTITLFGPTKAVRTAPWPLDSHKNIALQSNVACSPCHMTPLMAECKLPICHKSITIEMIRPHIRTFLGDNKWQLPP